MFYEKKLFLWSKVPLETLRNKCLEKGHWVVAKTISENVLVLECLDCGKLWRIRVGVIEYAEGRDVPEELEGEN